MYFNIVFVYF